MRKIVGLIISVVGILFIFTTYSDLFHFWLGDQPQQIHAIWVQDIEKLKSSKSLPKSWEQIKEVQYFPTSRGAKKLLQEIDPPLQPTNKDGNFRLEVSLDDWKEKGERGLMIQYQLIDLKTQNLVWELGRTLIFKSEASSELPLLQDKSK